MRYISRHSGMEVDVVRIGRAMTMFYADGDQDHASAGDYLICFENDDNRFATESTLRNNYRPKIETPGATIAIHLDGLEKLERAHTLALETAAAIDRIKAALV